ncbi:hypothetical protein [Streptacidiphilus albus]|uniref:hypothetical protein n=1 Tax=Streptacidiphilus albus TaxID=105425 RepID=UPI00054BD69D|nr:hypothetical protein [Streptacidiphilus albus]
MNPNDRTAPSPHAPAAPPSASAATLHRAVLAEPGRTAAALALAAGLGRSTAGKLLTTMETGGLVRREPGGHDGTRRLPDRWHPTTTATAPDNAPQPGPEREQTGSAVAPAAESASATERGEEPVQRASTAEDPSSAPASPAFSVQPPTERDTDPQEEVEAPGPEAGTDEAADPSHRDLVNALERGTADSGTPDEPTAAVPVTQDGDDGLASPSPGTGAAADGVCPMCGHRRRVPGVRTTSSGTRLGQGQLHELALEHLRSYPDEEFTATGIAKVIGRSSGAIANALATMVNRGEAEMTCSVPRRYRALPGGASR